LPQTPAGEKDADEDFDDRSVRVETTFGGAGDPRSARHGKLPGLYPFLPVRDAGARRGRHGRPGADH
jgi:hypothetical protein